jgi:hypothetical protein
MGLLITVRLNFGGFGYYFIEGFLESSFPFELLLTLTLMLVSMHFMLKRHFMDLSLLIIHIRIIFSHP